MCIAPPSNCAAAATCVSADGPFARLKEGFEEINKQAKEEFEKAKLRSHWQHEENDRAKPQDRRRDRCEADDARRGRQRTR